MPFSLELPEKLIDVWSLCHCSHKMCVHRLRDPVRFTGFLLYFLKNIFRKQRERRSRELSCKGSLCQEQNGQGGGSIQEPTQVARTQLLVLAGSWSQNPEAEIEPQHSNIRCRDPNWCLKHHANIHLKRSDLRTLNNTLSSCPFLPLSPCIFPGSTLPAGL